MTQTPKHAMQAGQRLSIVLVISNLEYGGAQRQVVELANNLDPARFKVTIVSFSDFIPLSESLTNAATEVVVLQKQVKYDAILPFRLARLLRRVKADLVHGFLFDAEIAARCAAKLAGVAVSIGSERNCKYSIKRIQQRVYDLTKSWQTSCIANSYAGAEFNAGMLGYPAEHYDVLHNGVDTSRFTPLDRQAALGALGLDESCQYVGIFSSFKQQKNHEMFFRAADLVRRKNKDVRFLVVGDELWGGLHGSSDYKKRVMDLVDELGIHDACVFVGNTTNVVAYYQACDLTVLSSLFEGFPNVALESLACGVPVVATNVSDNAILIPDGVAGYLVDVGDQDALARRILELLGDPQQLESFSDAARAWIEAQFSVSVMARRAAWIYESRVVMSGRSRRA